MDSTFTAWNMAEVALLFLGVVVVMIGAARVTGRRAWPEVLRFPAPPETRFTGIEAIMAILLLMAAPTFAYYALEPLFPKAPASQPAETNGPRVFSGADALAGTLGQSIAVLVMLALARGLVPGGWKQWGLRARSILSDTPRALIAFVALWPGCFIIVNVTTLIAQSIDPGFQPPDHSALRTIRDGSTPIWIGLLTIFGAIVLAPMAEELCFRGIIQLVLARQLQSTWAAIAITAVFFGLFHFGLPHTIPALVFFGVILGYVYARGGSLGMAILLHAVFNAKNVVWALGQAAPRP